jgi:hypothetical protein
MLSKIPEKGNKINLALFAGAFCNYLEKVNQWLTEEMSDICYR